MRRNLVPTKLKRTLDQVLAVPTVPFYEQWLSEYLVERLTKHRGISVLRDSFGNLVFRYRPRKGKRAKFAFQAHLDHPGFVVKERLSDTQYLVRGIGGHGQKMPGGTIRFFSSATDTGTLAKILSQKPVHRGEFELVVSSQRELVEETIGMWNFPHLTVSKKYVSGRSFDDTLGVSLLTAVLEEASRRRLNQPFDVIFTRAEEAGLHGVLALVKQRKVKIPKYIVNIEMPYARKDFKLGDGAMIRVGDKLTTFDFELICFLDFLAERLSKRNSDVKFQKRIAARGFTEVSVFAMKGYQSAALCLPVRNAHNISDLHGKPAAEQVDPNDLMSLYLLLLELVTQPFDLRAGKAAVWKKIQDVASGKV